jgi:hypothetical protein
VTTTLLGAGYLGAVVTLVLCLPATDWRRVRIHAVGFTLTSMTLLVTLWDLSERRRLAQRLAHASFRRRGTAVFAGASKVAEARS